MIFFYRNCDIFISLICIFHSFPQTKQNEFKRTIL